MQRIVKRYLSNTDISDKKNLKLEVKGSVKKNVQKFRNDLNNDMKKLNNDKIKSINKNFV